MYSVTVLTPKGRRQQVKVTPNTTILQILEEVCSKHGFNAQEYDLRHHNKILDVSSMFRFTSLPNNAQLEMTEALTRRQESPVTLGFHFETGERLTGVFSPSDSVWDVIVSVKPEEEKLSDLVVIYMRQEIYGTENLKTTTLRSLGLTSGRAMLRVLHKAPEELHMQANVSSILSPRVTVSDKEEGSAKKDSSKSPESPKKAVSSDKSNILASDNSKTKNQSPETNRKEPKYKSDAINLRGNIFENLLRSEKTKKKLLETSREYSESSSSRETHLGEESNEGILAESVAQTEVPLPNVMEVAEETPNEESRVILLGDRNAVAFNLNSVKPPTFEEEPDDFYELTVYDAQLLLKQAKQLCADLEDAPLMTSAQREFEKDKKVLSMLHQYKKTVLRVKFPDRTVLQGTFAPLETVSAVEKFVSEYLESPKLKFYLYTTPPKVVLKSDTRLIECGCVPSCVLYFGLPPEVPPPSQYLKTEVLEKLSTPSAAALHAYKTRGKDKKLEVNDTAYSSEETDAEKRKWLNNVSNSEAGPSGSQNWEKKPKDPGNSPQFKMPKWFRSNK